MSIKNNWHNRDKWAQYKAAVNEMVIRTSTEFCEWSLEPANDKHFARILVLKTLCERLASALDK